VLRQDVWLPYIAPQAYSNTVRYGCTVAGFETCLELEEKYLKDLRFRDVGYGKQGDILLSTLDDLLNVDISIVHPASDTLRGKAGKVMGAAAAVRDEAKRNDQAKHETKGYSFVPFRVESYGCLGKEADQLYKDLADGAASTCVCERVAFLHWIRKRSPSA
jgi:hypothetical protein